MKLLSHKACMYSLFQLFCQFLLPVSDYGILCSSRPPYHFVLSLFGMWVNLVGTLYHLQITAITLSFPNHIPFIFKMYLLCCIILFGIAFFVLFFRYFFDLTHSWRMFLVLVIPGMLASFRIQC